MENGKKKEKKGGDLRYIENKEILFLQDTF